MNPKWSSKFELKPGKWVFVPTHEAVAAGEKIKEQIEDHWTPPDYYYHLRAGGHVAALKSHLGHTSFVHVDIRDFFGSINRTRVTRCLKQKFSYVLAREWAIASTVIHPGDKKRSIIPYGFVQSQVVAALCLAESALGICLDKIRKMEGVAVSVYVDDIIVSSSDEAQCTSLLAMLKTAAERARFALNPDKEQGPGAQVTAFNISLSSNSMLIESARLQQFVEALEEATSEAQRKGILSYVSSINADQGKDLHA